MTGTAGQFPYYNGASTLAATSTIFLSTGQLVGIGTSTPYSKLSVWGDSASVGRAFEVVNSASTTLLSIPNLSTGTSTFATALQATALNITSTTATSTFARGIDLAGGCFSINGTCVGGGGTDTVVRLGSIQTFTTGTNATYTTPASTSYIVVEVWGGGGGGGGAGSGDGGVNGGGGGGAGGAGYSSKFIVNPSTTYKYTVGGVAPAPAPAAPPPAAPVAPAVNRVSEQMPLHVPLRF